MSFFKAPAVPAAPPPPPPPPNPPQMASSIVQSAGAASRAAAAAANGGEGFNGTIKTGPRGVLNPDDNRANKQLLGSQKNEATL